MLILLLLLSHASCDWVEISQNHYRKKPSHKVRVTIEQTTTSNRMYRNLSTPDQLWRNGAIDKLSKVANIRRVQNPMVKTSSLNIKEDNRFSNNFNDHKDTTNIKYSLVTRKPNMQQTFIKDDDDVVEYLSRSTISRNKTEDVHHEDNLNTKPVKKVSTTVNIFEKGKHFDNNRKAVIDDMLNSNQIKEAHVSKLPSLYSIRNNDNHERDEKKNTVTITKHNLYSVSSENVVNTASDSDFKHINQSFTQQPNKAKIELIRKEDLVTENYIFQESVPSKIDDRVKIKAHHTISRPIDEHFHSKNKFENVNTKIVTETNIQMPTYNIENKASIIDKKIKPSITDSKSVNIPNVAKERPLKEMWKLLKVVADTIYKNTHRSFNSKINYLEGLKSTILTSIEDQIESAWPDDSRGAPTRRPRAAQPRGHVEIPSSESTLMTISFLTFAVFLIKLVLQVIHTYKNKTMMVAPAVVAAVGRAAAALRTAA